MKTNGKTDGLFERIVILAEAYCGNEHIPMIIDNNINIPDRT